MCQYLLQLRTFLQSPPQQMKCLLLYRLRGTCQVYPWFQSLRVPNGVTLHLLFISHLLLALLTDE